MFMAYQCCSCGFKDFDDTQSCASCGGMDWEAYEAGSKPAEKGAPTIFGDHINKYYDWNLSAYVNSRHERDKAYSEAGLELKSVKEHKNQHPNSFEATKGTIISFPGQKNRKSKV